MSGLRACSTVPCNSSGHACLEAFALPRSATRNCAPATKSIDQAPSIILMVFQGSYHEPDR